MADEKKAFHLVVAEKLIDQLERGTAPWQKPWAAGESYLPYNPTTGKTYKGINSLQLLSEERSDPRWLTYKQAQAEGAQVRRGEKGTLVQYWKFEEERPVKGADGKPVLDATGQQTKEVAQLRQPRVFFATVFSAEQIEGLPPLARKPVTWNVEAAAEARLNLATVKHDQVDQAFYRRSTDVIHMPGRGQFADAISYYQVGLHELAHWSGHPGRMNRKGGNPFGSPEYAREELRAEIASLLMGEETGIGHEPGRNSAAYVASWVKDLQEQPLEIFRAAAEAEKIRAYITERAEERNVTRSAAGQTCFHAERAATTTHLGGTPGRVRFPVTENLSRRSFRRKKRRQITRSPVGRRAQIVVCHERDGRGQTEPVAAGQSGERRGGEPADAARRICRRLESTWNAARR